MLLKGIVAVLIVFAPCVTAQTAVETRTIEALLAEVRQLRLALERSALVAPKLQLTMQRLMLQDQKVARLSVQLDTIRREIAGHNAATQHVAQELPRIEQQLSAETDPVRRKALERERQNMKAMADRVVDPQLLARESEVARTLQNEHAIAQELTDKLAAMERLLDTPAPAAP